MLSLTVGQEFTNDRLKKAAANKQASTESRVTGATLLCEPWLALPQRPSGPCDSLSWRRSQPA